MSHVMLDLETLGLAPGSIVLSIGAVAFDPADGVMGHQFYRNIDRASCERFGLVACPATEAWWQEQSEEARSALLADLVDLPQALSDFAEFYRGVGGDRIWSHGANFDTPMIEAAYRAVGMPAPWGHREPRDTRTIFELAGLDFKQAKYAEGVEHNALDDARNQAVGVIDAYALLGKASASA